MAIKLFRFTCVLWACTSLLLGYGKGPRPKVTGGIKIHSWGHVFTIMASTSTAFTPEKYGVNARPDFSLGFNIYRRIR